MAVAADPRAGLAEGGAAEGVHVALVALIAACVASAGVSGSCAHVRMVHGSVYVVKDMLTIRTSRLYRVNMDTVNERIRQAVRIELAKRDSNQAKLAERIGVSRQQINNVMRARAGNVPSVWQRIFDELDLELVVQQRDTSR